MIQYIIVNTISKLVVIKDKEIKSSKNQYQVNGHIQIKKTLSDKSVEKSLKNVIIDVDKSQIFILNYYNIIFFLKDLANYSF